MYGHKESISFIHLTACVSFNQIKTLIKGRQNQIDPFIGQHVKINTALEGKPQKKLIPY